MKMSNFAVNCMFSINGLFAHFFPANYMKTQHSLAKHHTHFEYSQLETFPYHKSFPHTIPTLKHHELHHLSQHIIDLATLQLQNKIHHSQAYVNTSTVFLSRIHNLKRLLVRRDRYTIVWDSTRNVEIYYIAM